MQSIGTHGCEVMYLGCVCFRGELGFLNCDDVCMCVVNKQFELLEFVFDSVYVDLLFTAGSVSLCCVCEVVVIPYVDAVVAVTVMRVLLFVLHVCLLRECDGVRLTAMLVWGCMRCGECRACGRYTWFRHCVWMSVVRGM